MATIFGFNIKLRNERWPRAESFYHNVKNNINSNNHSKINNFKV